MNAFVESSADLVEKFRLAVREKRLDDAQELLEEVDRQDPEVAARPVYKMMLSLARDDAQGAWRGLNESAHTTDDLRAVCLRALGDPSWEGIARGLVDDSPDPRVRQAMCVLLHRDDAF